MSLLAKQTADADMKAPAVKSGDAKAALAALVDRDFLDSRKYEEQQWRADRKNAHLLIVEFEKRFIKRLRELGVPAFCHAMVRTRADQKKAFDGGFSTKDGAEPYAHEHCAVDIIHSKYGWNMSREHWLIFGHVGKEVAKLLGIDITWGGDWKSKRWPDGDPAHWELKDWRERNNEVLR